MKIFNLKGLSKEEQMLKVIQPFLLGLIDGTLSTLAPVFALAYSLGTEAALLAGLAAASGAALSMGIAEATSDDGILTNRGSSISRGVITGIGTFIGGIVHVLPFLFSDLNTALTIAYPMVVLELTVIAWIRNKYMNFGFRTSLLQVALGGIIIIIVGIALGANA